MMRVFSLCLSLLAGASLAVSPSPPGRPAPHSACLPGWTDRTGSGLGCILLDLEAKRNWNEAQDFCRDLAAAHLVEIFSPEQQADLELLVEEAEVETGLA